MFSLAVRALIRLRVSQEISFRHIAIGKYTTLVVESSDAFATLNTVGITVELRAD